MFPAIRLSQQGLLLVAIPLVFELMFVGVLTSLIYKVHAEAKAAEESKTIIARIDTLEKDIYVMFTSLVTFITGHRSQEGLYRHSRESCLSGMSTLSTELKNRYDDETINELNTSMKELLRAIDRSQQSLMKTGLTAFIMNGSFHTSGLQDHVELLIQDFDQIEEHEKKVSKVETLGEANARKWLVVAVLSGVVLNIVVALVLARYFSRSVVSKMQRLGENANLFSQMRPMLPVLDENTEFAELDRALHEMAITVENSVRRERAAIENAVDVICTVDSRGDFLALSPAVRRAWGYEPEALIGQPYYKLTSGAQFDAEKLSMGRFEWDAELARSDSSKIITSWSVNVSADKTLFCVVRDITEKRRAELLLKASEAEIRSLVENMFTAVVKTTALGVIVGVNPRTEELLGFSANELIEHELSSVFKLSGEVTPTQFFETLAKNALNRVVEYTAIDKAANEVAVDICLSRYDTGDGDAYVVNILDSSERRRVEDLKRQFTAMVSHDLRTPLNSVSNMLELTLAGAYGEITETCTSRMEIALKNVGRLMDLINELLELEKLESGTMQLELSSLNVDSVLNQAIWSVEDFANRHEVKLVQIASAVSFLADEKRLVQVLINLLSNSIKFSPPNSTVKVEASQNSQFTEIKVTDQGQGIPKDKIPYLFDRFSQVSQTGRANVRSTGLGLSICKSIIELHGGRIIVDSEIGIGSTFSLQFPIVLKPEAIASNN